MDKKAASAPRRGVVFEDERPLVEIEILGETHAVPGKESLLRGLQTLGAIRAYTEFCWNGDCVNCKVDCVTPKGEKRAGVLSCRVMAERGMRVTRLYSPFLKMPPKR